MKSRLTDLEASAIAISIMAVGSVSETILASVQGIGRKGAKRLMAFKPGKAEDAHIFAMAKKGKFNVVHKSKS